MDRIIKATLNSWRAFRYLASHEAAFRQEMLLLAAAVPVGWYLAQGWRGYGLLLGSLLVLIIIEVLNTAIEAACNAVSREYNVDIQLAKDCGSLAVAFAAVMAIGVWALAIWERFFGVSL